MNARASKSPGRATGFLLVVGLLGLFGLGTILHHAQCGTSWVGDRFIIPYRPAADLTAADREFTLGGMRLRLAIAPRPVAPMKEFALDLALSEPGGAPLIGVELELAWNMDMDMGRIMYRPAAVAGRPGRYRANVTLPVCIWGGTRWYGRLRVSRGAQTDEQVFILDLE